MIRVGVTGGIATGKSAASRVLADRGYPVLDADAVYHGLLETDTEMLAELRARFGDGCFTEGGELDRQVLGPIVFGDPAALADLGAIAHPRVRREMVAWLEARGAEEEPPRAVFVVIPLLFENGLEELFDRVWVVACAPEVQEARLRSRDGIDAEAAGARIRSQMPLAEKVARADRVIPNDGDLEELAAAVDHALGELP